MSDEVRIIDANTGGEKGQKLERYDLIPWPFIEQLALVYGKGALKYSEDNWRKGYSWRLSFGALMRHLTLFWMGEWSDQETGLPHLAHVAWHAATLYTFYEDDLGTDDRPDVGKYGGQPS